MCDGSGTCTGTPKCEPPDSACQEGGSADGGSDAKAAGIAIACLVAIAAVMLLLLWRQRRVRTRGFPGIVHNSSFEVPAAAQSRDDAISEGNSQLQVPRASRPDRPPADYSIFGDPQRQAADHGQCAAPALDLEGYVVGGADGEPHYSVPYDTTA